jgi:hypothetical protein
MNELEQFQDDMAVKLFGRSKVLAVAGKQCVKCGASELEFKDEVSKKEYGISGLCQTCQDEIFG